MSETTKQLEREKKEKELALYRLSQQRPEYYPARSEEMVTPQSDLGILDLPDDIQEEILKQSYKQTYQKPLEGEHQGIKHLPPEEQSKYYKWRDKVKSSVNDLDETKNKFSLLKKLMEKK